MPVVLHAVILGLVLLVGIPVGTLMTYHYWLWYWQEESHENKQYCAGGMCSWIVISMALMIWAFLN